jgi:hypothetical protein
MPYVLPSFNLTCEVYGNSVPGFPPGIGTATGPRLTGQPCALVYGRRVNPSGYGVTAPIPFQVSYCMSLLLPLLTDIRTGLDSGGTYDIVEVPSGTGRYYIVGDVDDIGKGWPNEHRSANLIKVPSVWVAPYL